MKQAKEFFLRRIAAVLAILMVVVMFPVGTPAMATETLPQEETSELAAAAPKQEALQPQGVTSDGLEYYAHADHVEITGYTGSATAMVIPAEIEGLPVTRIGSYAFCYCSSLTSISIPGSVTSIDYCAFFGCSSLTSISIPSIVTSIGNCAFYGCSSLTSINIPSGVTSIGYSTFENCSSLTSISIPSSVTSIGYSAFEDCSSLTSINIPNGVTSIEDATFSGCSSLTSISIPSSVNNIGHYAFYGCSSLTSINIPNGVTSVEDATFSGCRSLTSIDIPSGVTSIGSSAFSGCSGLTSINIPSGVTSIGSSAFRGCSSLTSINIPSSVTSIGSSAFEDCSRLNSINIPSGVTSIGSSTFFGCSSLTSIQISSSVTTIGSFAFFGCSSLASINIPSSVTSIAYYAFSGCSSLTSINIPSGVTSIGSSAFSGCSSLTSITVDSSNTTYTSREGILYDKAMTQLITCPVGKQGSVVIPNGVTSIYEYAFSGCSGLTSIQIPNGVTSIEDATFYGCSSLTSINIPSGVTEIHGWSVGAFEDCSSLSSINIPSSVDYIGNCAFSGCSSLTSIVLPENLSSISWEMFNGCSSLSEITIPESVTRIVYESFVGCDSLCDVYYGGSKSGWDAISIGHSNEDLTNATIHYAKVDAHDTIDELTDVDYMLFAELAYKDLSSALGDPTANPVKEPKTIGEFYANKWDKKWSTYDLTYGQVFGSIANWYPASTHSTYLGYQDVVFCNASGDVVIAYRGSDNIAEVLTDPNSFGDWVINDLQSEIFSHALPQIDDALETYTMVAASIDPGRIAVTGHSLGGALADVVAAYSGSKGVSFNAISALDVAYGTKPLWMAKNFEGVNRWSFVDHANEYDILAGTFEEQFYSTRIKPYVAHKSLCGKDALADVVDNHGLHSYLTTDSTGALALTAQMGKYIPDEPITHFSSPLLAGKFKLELGTSGNDFIGSCLNEKKLYSVSFGGNGYDQIWAGAKNDYLAGGNGQDLLDGSWGNDTYIYYKGDGMDYINDVGGRDNLYLLGFDDDDVIAVVEQDYLYITCNDEKIIAIKTEGREYEWFTSNAFTVMRQKENGNTVPFDITNYFKPSVYKSRILVGCPVSVEILDPDGNVIHTLTDGEVGSWYTDYGNFYVFEEENGEYGKVLDLVEGYTARIVGADEGTMDVTYQVPVDGELTDPVSVSGVPVTENLSATIVETVDGDVYLVIDEDSDGETDSERKLYGECPFTDVPEGSFYYEPVMWAVEEGITNGATETTYNPNGTCLRAQVVTFLHRADGNPEPTSTRNPFTDVKSGDFFYQPVLWAVEKGITNGVSATAFGSYANCNRAAVVTFLWRAAGSPEPESTSNPFVDVKTTDFFYKPVLWAVENGITNGVDATHFGPATDCNRAQVVTFLYRAYN